MKHPIMDIEDMLLAEKAAHNELREELFRARESKAALLEALRGLVHAEKRFSKESGMNLDDPIVKAVYTAERAIQLAESTDKVTI